MKLKYLFIPFLAAFTLASCTVEDPISPSFKDFSIEPSLLEFKADGAPLEAAITASAAWAFEELSDEVAEWLEISPMSGNGNATVKFTAKNVIENTRRSVELRIRIGDEIQFIRVGQGEDKMVITPIADALTYDDGKMVYLQGVIANLANTVYGNFDLVDKSGTIYVYGMLDEKGNQKNFLSLGIDEGDEVIISGPRSSHNGKPQMKDAELVKVVKKSLLKIKTPAIEMEKDASEFVIEAVAKKDDIQFNPDFGDAAPWFTLSGIAKDGLDYKITFAVQPYTGLEPREATVELSVGDNTSKVKVVQYGNTPDPVSIAEAIRQPMKTWLSVEGTVVGVHNKGVVVSDGKDAIYVYINNMPSVKFGHKVLVTGELGAYSKFFQIASPIIRDLGSAKVEQPKPVQANSELINSILAGGNRTCEYIEVTGVPEGQYGDISVDNGYKVAPYQTSSFFKYPKNFEGKQVTIKGYAIQANAKYKNIRIVVTDINEVK